jgi:hypothetical protein
LTIDIFYPSDKKLREAETKKKANSVELPPVFDKAQLCPLVTSYSEIVEYQQISFQLLLLEVWEEVCLLFTSLT